MKITIQSQSKKRRARPRVANFTALAHEWRVLRLTHQLLLLLGGLMLAAGCSREENPAASHGSTTNQGPSTAAGAPVAQSDAAAAFARTVPSEGGPDGYVGSSACQSCHADQFTSWHRTYHRTMTQYARPETVRADFHNQVLTNDGTRFRLTQTGEALNVRMERVTPAPGEESAGLDTRVGLVTGSHHMQVFWIPGEDGNAQLGFPFTWLIPEHRWVPRNSTFIRPPGTVHRSEVWNVICSRCHATAIEPRVNQADHTITTRAAELGISCEACHGPGARHAAARKSAVAGGAKPDTETLRQEIVQPRKLDAIRSAQVCGFCHSMKWIDTSEGWLKNGFRYRPGDNLEATTPLIQPGRTNPPANLLAYLAKNPDILNDFFWSDGMGRVSGREYNGLVESPCFKGGKFSCLSCHSMHESEPDDMLADHRQDNLACLQCHERLREPAALQAHTHHRAGSTGGECYNCHMPHTTYGILSAIRSHQISSPRVRDQLATGRPNACNLCHLDKTLAWTARQLAQWYGQPAPELDAADRTVASSVRLTLTGDAGQRALLAWHYSWAPARSASGTNWMAPLLGVLLDDPYAAVRCVAARSLRATGDLEPAGYDYVPEPGTRPAALPRVSEAWNARLAAGTDFPAEVLVKPGSPETVRRTLADWLRQRDPRPVRLRE